MIRIPASLTIAMLSVLLVFAPLGSASLDPTFASGAIDQDGSWTHAFTEPGSYPYICGPHPWMTGTVVVTDDPGAPTMVTVDIRDYVFSPANVTIRSGGSVTWVNHDPVIHTAEQEGADGSGAVGHHGMMGPWGMMGGPWWLIGATVVALMTLVMSVTVILVLLSNRASAGRPPHDGPRP